MKQILERITDILYHYAKGKRQSGKNIQMYGDCIGLYGDCTYLYGDCTGLYGDCTGLYGDCTRLYGNCTGLYGDLDVAELTDEERQNGVSIKLFIKK